MREDVGLALRAEFEEAAEAVEAVEVGTTKAVAPRFPSSVMEKFHATEADLKVMASRYTGLTIAGALDKAGYNAVHSARMELRDARILIEKTRKAENDEKQAAIKMCNNVAKYLTGIISPTEEALEAEEKRVDAELEAIKAQKQAEAAAALEKRIQALQAVQAPFSLAEITVMTDTQFGFVLASATEAFQAKEKIRIEAEAALAKQQEEARLAAEKAAAEKAEADRLEREAFAKAKAEQAEEARKMEAARAALKAEQDAFEAKKRAEEQAAREKQIAEEAAARAKAKAEQDAKDAQAKAEREKAEAAALAKAQAEAKPDAEKILALSAIVRGIAFPKLATDSGRAAMVEIEASFTKFAAFIEGKAKALSPITNVAP